MSEELEALYRKAELLFRGERWVGAIATYTEIIRLENDTEKKALVYYNRGNAYSEKGDPDRAIQDYDQAIARNPNEAAAYTDRGNAYSKKGDLDRAIQDYDQAIARNPNYADAYYNRGIAYSEKGDLDRAIQDYDQAIALNPNEADAYTNRGNAYSEKGDLDRAIQDYDQAIARNPNYAAAYTNRGIAYSKKGDLDRAIQDYDQAIARNPNHAAAYTNRGIAYSKKGDPDRAIQDYDQAIALNPNEAAAYNNRGTAYSEKGDHDRAIQDYDQAIALNPNYAAAYNNRGTAYSKKGDLDRAIQDYDQAIALNPNYAAAYYNRGIAYGQKEDYASAFKDFVSADKYDKKKILKSFYPFVYIASQLARMTDDSSGFFGPYTKLLFAIEEIKQELFFGSSAGREIAHYTSLHVLKALANKNPFRLYNVAYMNDPEEGQVFFEIIKDKTGIDVQETFYGNDSADSHFPPAYIGSFVKIDSQKQNKGQSFPKDKLFLWRTYGKHDNEEAAGACLIFDAERFAKKMPSLQIGAMLQLQAGRGQSVERGQQLPPALYKVIYKRDIEKPLIEKSLLDKLKKLASLLDDIRKLINETKNKDDKRTMTGLAQELLDGIRFLFKADHYNAEKEVRVIRMSYYADKEEQTERKVAMEHIPPRFYLDMPGKVPLSQVILGPKTANLSDWKQWLKENNIKNVDKSDIKFK